MTTALTTIAIPLAEADTGGGYVAAAYLVFVALLLIYIAIMSKKLARIHRELGELVERVRDDGEDA